MAKKQESMGKKDSPEVLFFSDQLKKRASPEMREEDIHKMRLRFAYLLVGLVAISNAVTLLLLFFLGFKVKGFYLSDTIIVAVISATVAELASLFIIILKYLFPSKDKYPDDSGG
jgi:hypothetical protein